MQRYLVTGTDTDVGKTRVTAALAAALRESGAAPRVVKLVQTGVEAGEPGDAERAGTLAECPYVEFARFRKPADPWSAALAEGLPSVRAEDLAQLLQAMPGALVAEGAGGLAVPLNRTQHFGTLAQSARLRIVLAVGLRLGCMNHALLTLALCEQLALTVSGCMLVDRWERSDPAYVADVSRVLQERTKILGILPFDSDEAASVRAGARIFATRLFKDDQA